MKNENQTENEYTDAQLLEIAAVHVAVLRQAVGRAGFRTNVPAGGAEAIKAGLVTESDPTWMYSDDHRASNGFKLTEAGRRAAHLMGWNCKCSACTEIQLERDALPLPTLGEYCANCEQGIKQYGAREYRGQPCCKFHYRIVGGQDADDPTPARKAPVQQEQVQQEQVQQEPSWARPAPDSQPITWRWRKGIHGTWVAVGDRPLAQGEQLPARGTTITVRRKDRSTSLNTVTGFCWTTRDGFPCVQVEKSSS